MRKQKQLCLRVHRRALPRRGNPGPSDFQAPVLGNDVAVAGAPFCAADECLLNVPEHIFRSPDGIGIHVPDPFIQADFNEPVHVGQGERPEPDIFPLEYG